MSKRNVCILAGAGLGAWLAATLFYGAFGAGLIERAFWFYALNAFLTAALVTFAFQATARLLRIPRARRLFPAMAFALPGVAAANLILLGLVPLAPGAEPSSLGRYLAFLIVLYISVGASVFERAPQKARH
ncbi:hypothetical protein [Caulobacter endophyticus]|uniref:hypothetical protein n=1 Tax=Caulobacter endophyticus TaxID=2172652 RepID=UPI00240EA95D|nr:hypothetical protein [Caulobacter endophyticus]MDG2531920.1 hypothetical protein [Caulobacter endophyticus]